MAAINPYLTFNGDTEEAFNFYKSVFGSEFTTFQRFKDIPSEEPSPGNNGEKIMHVALPISKETVLMGSDVPDTYPAAIFGNNFSISINTDSQLEADKIFGELSAEGIITLPLEKTFWGAYFGMLTDKFGINWMVNYDLNQK